MFRRKTSSLPGSILHLNDIDEAAQYQIGYEDTPDKSVVSGSRLTAWPIKVDDRPGSAIFYYGRAGRGSVEPETD